MAAESMRARLDRLASHPWLVGDPAMPGRELAKRVRLLTIAAILSANAVGVAVIASFAIWALPKPKGLDEPSVVTTNLAVGAGYLALALILGVIWGRRLVEDGPDGIRGWFERDRQPTPKQRLRVLRGPLRIMAVQAVLWGSAARCALRGSSTSAFVAGCRNLWRASALRPAQW